MSIETKLLNDPSVFENRASVNITPAIAEALVELTLAIFQDLGALEAIISNFGLMGRVDLTVMTKTSPKQVVYTQYVPLNSKHAVPMLNEATAYIHSISNVNAQAV